MVSWKISQVTCQLAGSDSATPWAVKRGSSVGASVVDSVVFSVWSGRLTPPSSLPQLVKHRMMPTISSTAAMMYRTLVITVWLCSHCRCFLFIRRVRRSSARVRLRTTARPASATPSTSSAAPESPPPTLQPVRERHRVTSIKIDMVFFIFRPPSRELSFSIALLG